MDRELYSLVNSGSGTPATSSVQDEATAPINWEDEKRTDLPQRSPERIQHLLKFENHQQTLARIANDLARYAHQKSGKGSNNPQTVQVDPGAVVPTIHQWSN
ncbi:MAG: hypothetical protein WCB00_24285 [Candidatus Acidiferrales bacterium]